MKIAIIAANGRTGSHILREALMRELDVTAIVINKSTLKIEDVPTLEKDLFHLTRDDVKPFDVLINAFSPAPGEAYLHVEAGKHLISLLEGSNKKLFVIGSSGCLYVDKNESFRLLDTEDYPEPLRVSAKYQLQNLEDLRQSSISWTFLSPSPMFDADGPRTGHYIIGKNRLVVNSQYNSYISYADFAVAVIDELKNKNHVNSLFTVASENDTSAS